MAGKITLNELAPSVQSKINGAAGLSAKSNPVGATNLNLFIESGIYNLEDIRSWTNRPAAVNGWCTLVVYTSGWYSVQEIYRQGEGLYRRRFHADGSLFEAWDKVLTQSDYDTLNTSLSDKVSKTTPGTITGIPTFAGGRSGSDGGKIYLSPPVTGTSIEGNAQIDLYGNELRFLAVNGGVLRLAKLVLPGIDSNSTIVTQNTSGTVQLINDRNTAVTGGMYNKAHLELVSNSGNLPSIGFHRGGISAKALFMDTDNAMKFVANDGSVEKILTQSDYNTLFQYANNGKTAVATAIGEPTLGGNTPFQNTADHITSVKGALATNLTNKGVTASASERLVELVTKVGQISTGATFTAGYNNVLYSDANSYSAGPRAATVAEGEPIAETIFQKTINFSGGLECRFTLGRRTVMAVYRNGARIIEWKYTSDDASSYYFGGYYMPGIKTYGWKPGDIFQIRVFHLDPTQYTSTNTQFSQISLGVNENWNLIV